MLMHILLYIPITAAISIACYIYREQLRAAKDRIAARLKALR